MSSAKLTQSMANTEYIAAGMIKDIRAFATKKGQGPMMANVTVTDYEGDLKMTFFPKIWEQASSQIQTDKVMAFSGKVDYNENYGYSFQVNEILDINSLKERAIQSIHIKLNEQLANSEKMNKLVDTLVANPGNCSVYLHIASDNKNFIIKSSGSIKVTPDASGYAP